MNKIAIAVLRERTALWEFIDARDRCEKALKREGYKVWRYNIRTTYLSRGRNRAVREFLTDPVDPDWLWFIDSDMVPPEDAGIRLMQQGQALISGLYFQKLWPYSPEAYLRRPGAARQEYYPVGEEILNRVQSLTIDKSVGLIDPIYPPMMVDAVGAGCLMIRRDVLESLPDDPFGPTETGYGEDVWFCRQAQEHGFKVWLDWTVLCGHLSMVPLGMPQFLAANRHRRPQIIVPN